MTPSSHLVRLARGTSPQATNWYIFVRDTPSNRAASATRNRSGASGGLTSLACTDELIGRSIENSTWPQLAQRTDPDME